MGDISNIDMFTGDEKTLYIIDNQIIYVYLRQNINVFNMV